MTRFTLKVSRTKEYLSQLSRDSFWTAYTPLKSKGSTDSAFASLNHFSLKAMYEAKICEPEPMRETPIGLPLRSDID